MEGTRVSISDIIENELRRNQESIMSTEYRWLPHLKNAIPPAGQGKRISTYTVALEGWRRGLSLKFYSVFEDGNKLKIRYSLSNGERTHHFSLSMGDKVTDKAFNICHDKDLTKKYLSEYGVPVPQGKMFSKNVDSPTIVEYAKSLGFPVVLKPTDGNAGRGVFANIQDINRFEELLYHVREELEFDNIIVEKFHPGEEFRIFVVGDKVLGAINRRPASVIGDGVHTIRQLIHLKNDVRRTNPHLSSRLIRIDKEIMNILEGKGYDLNTVPEKDELVSLREKSNLSAGGDAVDVTDLLTDNLKKIAINAGKAIPGLAHYGVDMIIDEENDTGVILEVNARPGIGGHLFPIQGKPRDFAKNIIDFYFPETKDDYRTPLFFDFDKVIEPVKRRSASSITVMSPPKEKLYGKKYIITGDFEYRPFRLWVRRKAIKREFHGYIEQLEDNRVELVVMGSDRNKINSFNKIFHKGYFTEHIEHIEESDWYESLLIGFKTTSEYDLSTTEIRELLRENQRIERERQILEKRYEEIRNSRAWRATFPVRFTLSKIKDLFRSENK